MQSLHISFLFMIDKFIIKIIFLYIYNYFGAKSIIIATIKLLIIYYIN